jgi:secondary thiamine-phosphate synthase enzyme
MRAPGAANVGVAPDACFPILAADAMKVLSLQTGSGTDFINITDYVRAVVHELGLREGAVTIFVPHTTAGITINENADPDVVRDLTTTLDRLVPWRGDYHHGEGNSAAHIKASLMGSSVRVLVSDGRLQLGTWQGVYFCEFDGPRQREVWLGA